jgi:hypothetical protein
MTQRMRAVYETMRLHFFIRSNIASIACSYASFRAGVKGLPNMNLGFTRSDESWRRSHFRQALTRRIFPI